MGLTYGRARGAYAVLSARYFFDDAIGDAGEEAEVLFLRGLAFSAGEQSDGFMTERQVAHVVGMGLEGTPERAKALVETGLWVPDEQRRGYFIRSWLKWNRSADEIESYRERDAARKRVTRPPNGRPGGGGSDVRAESAVRTGQDRTGQDNVQTDADASVLDVPANAPDPIAQERRPAPPPPEVAELRQRLNRRRSKPA